MFNIIKSIFNAKNNKANVLVHYIDPDDSTRLLCQFYSASVWQKIQDSYNRLLDVTSVEYID